VTVAKRFVFAGVTLVVALAAALGVLLIADLYVHHRVEQYAGVNIWGYRGPRVRAKQPVEHRLVVLGGSTAFGYGVVWSEAFPAQLERDLQPLSRNGAPVRVINLGMNSQGAYSFKYTLQDYLNLEYDTAILYEGYNDLDRSPNEFVGRHDSPVFRLTGYYPILATALREKAMSLRSGGDIDAAYRGKVVFHPGVAARTTASALEAAQKIGATLDAQFERVSTSRPPPSAVDQTRLNVSYVGCNWPWEHYCGSVYDAIVFALAHRKKVLVVTQPYVTGVHREQQENLRWMLAGFFAKNPDVGYIDLGNAVDLRNPEVAYDHLHLTAAGNGIISRDLRAPVAALMPEAFNHP
jgi:hypothetical protein